MIDYRKMTEEDIPAGLALCRSAGWNQLENDWKIFMELDAESSRVAVDENGKVVGSVTTVNYENHFSWVGMVLVDPEKKRQGIGTQLLREALQILQHQETVKLDATPAGREVYLKSGFRDEYALNRMVATDLNKLPETNAVGTSPNDLELILKKDKEVFGASRKKLLEWLHEKYTDLSFVIPGESGHSFSFGRKGFNFTQVGPVIANNTEQAIQLTTTAINNITGPVVMDVMHDSAFYHWLLSIGFTEQRKLIRMFRGPNAYPGIPEKQFAILGPEFG